MKLKIKKTDEMNPIYKCPKFYRRLAPICPLDSER